MRMTRAMPLRSRRLRCGCWRMRAGTDTRPPPSLPVPALASCSDPALTLCSCQESRLRELVRRGHARGGFGFNGSSAPRAHAVTMPRALRVCGAPRGLVYHTHTASPRLCAAWRRWKQRLRAAVRGSWYSAGARLIPRAGWIWPQVSLVDTVQQGKVGAIPLKRGDRSPLWGYGVNDYRYLRLLAVIARRKRAAGDACCFQRQQRNSICFMRHSARSANAASRYTVDGEG